MINLLDHFTIEQIKYNATFDLPDKKCGWIKNNECTFNGMCNLSRICHTILICKKYITENKEQD